MPEGRLQMSDNTPMTAEQILAMEPGREMDALIAEMIMSHNLHPGDNGSRQKYYAPDPKRSLKLIEKYSTDISAAWEIVEKLQGIQNFNGKKVRLHVTVSAIRGTYTALISDYLNDRVIAEQMGATAPEAICRAALLARLEGLNS